MKEITQLIMVSKYNDAAFLKFQMLFTQMQIRKCQDIHSRSSIKILEVRSDLYSAIIDDKLCMKIGDGSWCPSDPEWMLAVSGDRYAVWHK
jgi:alpha-amylase